LRQIKTLLHMCVTRKEKKVIGKIGNSRQAKVFRRNLISSLDAVPGSSYRSRKQQIYKAIIIRKRYGSVLPNTSVTYQIKSIQARKTGSNSKKASSLVDGKVVLASRIQLPKQSTSRFYKHSYLT
jgi:hypothetical protein